MNNIKWNEVTWYSKMLALVIFIVLPFLFFYYGVRYGETVSYVTTAGQWQTPASSTAQESDYYRTPAEWQTDANNTAGGFTIAYPIDFDAQNNYSVKPVTDWRLGADNTPGVLYFTLTVPKAFEPQTNLAEVKFTIGASGNDLALAHCMDPGPTGEPGYTTSTIAVNGVTFDMFKTTDAGAGNLYTTTSYRTLHGARCYAIEYTVHSAQIANYPASYNLKPYDEQKIDSLMRGIIGTFKFN